MTGQDAAEAIIALIRANVASLNMDADLAASGFWFSADPMPTTAGVTDAYRYLKAYDPIKVVEGLTVAVIAGEDHVVQRMTQCLAEREVPVTIAVYLLGDGTKDPEKTRRAKTGAVRALSTLLMGRRTIAAPAGDLYAVAVGDRHYGAGLKVQQGDFVVHVATIALTARFIEQE